MELIQSTPTLVKCPHCGNKFNPEESIGHDIRIRLEYEMEQKMLENSKRIEERIRRQEADRYASQLRTMQEDQKAKTSRLRELEGQLLNVQQREQLIREREETVELELKRRFLDREKVLREQLEKSARDKAFLEIQEREQKLAREREQIDLIMRKRLIEETERAREEERLKTAELQKKLDDQIRLVNEMKRKSEQGSMQMQGEVQELAIEAYLTETFVRDEVEEVTKGKRGGDCVHVVKDEYDRACGRILYESKRTKHFSNEWIPKLKADMRLQQADLGVIVTEAMPEGVAKFCEVDGIWICSYLEFKALAIVFRQNFLRIGELIVAQENRGEKMNMLYSYVTGNEFKQKLEAVFESYRDMQDDLQKEKALFTAQWARREKRLLKSMENLVTLYGDVRGIAGGAVPEISALEFSEHLLPEKS